MPTDHPARLIDELFHAAAFTPLFAEWTREYYPVVGQPPYHSRALAMLY